MNGTMGAGDVLGTVFMFINMGLLTLGGIFLSYKGLAAITHTAQDGEFMGKSFNTVWVPIRIGTGVVSLIPIAGGWSALQIVMLWIGVMGAGLGNMAWQGAVENFKPFRSFVLQPVDGSTADKQFIPNLYKMHACVRAHNLQENSSNWNMARVSDPGYAGLSAVQFGSASGANAECGKISMSQISETSLGEAAVHGSTLFTSATTADVGINTRNQKIALAAATQKVFDKYSDLIKTSAYAFVDNAPTLMATKPDALVTILPPDPVAIRDWGYKYQAEMSDAIAKAMVASKAMDSTRQEMIQHAKDDGFTTAGAFYMTMAQASYAINAIAQSVSPTIISGAQEPTPTDTVWSNAYNMINQSSQSAQVGVITGGGSSTPNAAWNIIKDFAPSSIGQFYISNIITEGSGEPVMIRLKNMADRVVATVSVFITVVAAASAYLEGMLSGNSMVGMAANVLTAGASKAALGGVKIWLDMILFVTQIAMGFFLMVSIYLPMVPFIIFMGQILNWMITIVEGVAAAPFLAFAHFDTDGEGLGQKTQYGYIFMLQSFMRPVMLVLGFIFSAMLLETVGGYVMAIYPVVLANVQMDSITGLFSVLGYVAIFYVIMVGLVNTCFSVTYLLPDAIFQFIGAHSSATSQAGRNEHQAIRDSAMAGAGISRQVMGQSRRELQNPGAGGGKDGVKPSENNNKR